MKYWLYTLIFGVIFFLSFSPFGAFAATEESCECYCSTSRGAQIQKEVEDTKSCVEACDDLSKAQFLGCFTEDQEELTPQYNYSCWTKEDCLADVVIDDGAEIPSVWGGQARECLEGEGYCYEPATSSTNAKLSIPLFGVSEVSGLSEYVAVVYKLLLVVGSFIAVIILMIGGLQYMVARGDSGQIAKAKERIGGAIFGVVLIFGSVVIAELIDPHLTSFDQFAFRAPKVKEIIFLHDSDNCNYLERMGARVSPNGVAVGSTALPGRCGSTGVVVGFDEGTPLYDDEEKRLELEGKECTYTECNGGKSCLLGNDNTYACYGCTDVYDGVFESASAGLVNPSKVVPSESVCGALTNQNGKDGDVATCVYFDASKVSGAFDSCIELVYPSRSGMKGGVISCTELRQNAAELDDPCSIYESVSRVSREGWVNDYASRVSALPTGWPYFPDLNTDNITRYAEVFGEMCNNDPCEVKPSTGCKITFIESNLLTGAAYATGAQIFFCESR